MSYPWKRRACETCTKLADHQPLVRAGGPHPARRGGSSARGTRAGWNPYPPFIAHGEGSRLTDVDGNEYLDYLLGLGPMLFGHRPPEVTEAVVRTVRDLGTVFALPYELEAEAAEKVVAAVPGLDMVRCEQRV